MKRREFVGKTAIGAAAAVVVPFPAFGEEKTDSPIDMVAVRGAEAADMFIKGIAAMGGMERFVKKGDKVVIKPNIGWDQLPEVGANTNPELVSEVVKACFAADAKEVLCFDHTCGNDWDNRYKMSGIAKAVEAAGGKMLAGNTQSMYVDRKIPRGVSLKDALVHPLTFEGDVFINIPVLKHHSGAKITCALKNYMGCIWDRSFWHKHNLPQCIADYATFQKTTLTIVDAYRVMLEYGPRGKDAKYAPVVKYQILSTDIVAADAAAVKIFESTAKQFGMGVPYDMSEIKYIALAEKLGVGTSDLKKLNVKRINMV